MFVFELKYVILACFWLKHCHMTKLWVSKVTFDLLIRFSVKNWPRKHICHDKLFRTQLFEIFAELLWLGPSLGPQNLKTSKMTLSKSAPMWLLSNVSGPKWAEKSILNNEKIQECPKMPFWGVFWFWAKLTGYPLWGQKWRFFEVRTSAVCCPFWLKIDMGTL